MVFHPGARSSCRNLQDRAPNRNHARGDSTIADNYIVASLRKTEIMDILLANPASQQTPAARPSLAGLGREGLRAALAAAGVPEKQLRMRVGQLWSWIYARGATSFEDMTDVAKGLRATLARAYSLDRPEVAAEQVSVDGTR